MEELEILLDLIQSNDKVSLIFCIIMATSIILEVGFTTKNKKPKKRTKILTNVFVSIIFGIIWYYVIGYKDIKGIIISAFASTGVYHLVIKRIKDLNRK